MHGVAGLMRQGVNVREVIKGKDSIKSGINTVRALFKSNRLHIHKSCQNLISELETYSYPEKRPNSNEPEVPIKENDHALDALRYVLSNYQGAGELSDIEKYLLAQHQSNRGTNFSR
jgi:phage terminase large subunit